MRSSVEALIGDCEQPLGIVVEVGEPIHQLGRDLQPPGGIPTQQPGVKRGPGKELVAVGLAQGKLQTGLDPDLP
jgi:hypothetical protein